MAIDPRTGRKFGDHGTPNDAINFCLDFPGGIAEIQTFLKCWREGNLDEWPEFYEWLKVRNKTEADADGE